MSNSTFSEKFIRHAFDLFEYQFERNDIFRAFSIGLDRTPETVTKLSDLPFLPIEFFKSHRIFCGEGVPELTFRSSGTTNHSIRSQHYVAKAANYEKSVIEGFLEFFNGFNSISLFALLPGYIENNESSLIYMVETLRKHGVISFKGYYLNDLNKLNGDLQEELSSGSSTILLLGVSFGLLDFAAEYPCNLQGHIVMETGGMKGRRKEILRSELHRTLKTAFRVDRVYSEYGMTEMLSQAYSSSDGVFFPTSKLKVLARDIYDPLTILDVGATGVLNIIDLSNADSCAFLATQDLGRVYEDGSFEVLGRTDYSDVRGCNLLAI